MARKNRDRTTPQKPKEGKPGPIKGWWAMENAGKMKRFGLI
jgi:hypothetical protein